MIVPPLRCRTVAVVAAATLVLGACSGDDRSTAEATTSSTETTTATDATDITTATGETEGLAPSSTRDDTEDSATLSRFALGPLALDQHIDDATATGLVGAWGEGCELNGTPDQVAELSPPIEGTVHAFDDAVYTIVVTGGPASTEPGGVGVGTSRADAQAAFEAAGLAMTIDETTTTAAGEWTWTAIDPEAGSVFGGAIDPATGAITAVATPFLPSCR